MTLLYDLLHQLMPSNRPGAYKKILEGTKKGGEGEMGYEIVPSLSESLYNYSSISKVFCNSLENGFCALGCDLDSRAAHFASKCSASWELIVGLGFSMGQPELPFTAVPFCVTLVVVDGKEFCGWPLTVGGEANVVVGKPPGRVGNPECWPPTSIPVLGPIPTPIATPLPVPAALQNTFATICEGVMPTTGTLALG